MVSIYRTAAVLAALGVMAAAEVREAAAAPVPKGDSSGRRPPTPGELAAAKKAYADLGGQHVHEFSPRHIDFHQFNLPAALNAEITKRVPDLRFDYCLEIFLGPNTSPGALRLLGRLQNLRWVAVRVSPLLRPGRDPEPMGLISELATIPNLEQLDLYPGAQSLLTDESAELMLKFKSLRRLVGSGPISDRGLEVVARHPRLESLSLQSCGEITDGGLAHLARMPNLRSLVLQGCPKPTALGFRHFTAEPRLTVLSIGGNGTTEDALAEIERIQTLEQLNLTDFRHELTDRGLRHLGRLPRLKWLMLPHRAAVTDQGLKDLANASALQDLYLSSCRQVTDAGMKELSRLSDLRSLSLRNAVLVTDEGLKDLSMLPRLETLVIGGANRVTNDGLRALTHSKSLTGMDLDGTTVTEAGVRAFVADRGERLRRLTLRKTPVSDKFVAELARRALDLEHLGIHECEGVTDASVDQLAKLVRLRFLAVYGTSISKDGIDTLRRRLPGCHVRGTGT